jgi:hypothetical protein
MKNVLKYEEVEELVSELPIHRKARLLSHDAALRYAARNAGNGDAIEAQTRATIVAYLRETAGDGTTVRAKHALKLADAIERGDDKVQEANAA